MAMNFDEGNWLVEKTLELERKPQLNYRNMLSAHTTNRSNGPLRPNGSIASCFRVELVCGGIRGHLHLPHSLHKDDNSAVTVQSDMHPNTEEGKKSSLNQACLRALVVLLRNNPMEVRLTPSNFARGAEGLRVVQESAVAAGPTGAPPVLPPTQLGKESAAENSESSVVESHIGAESGSRKPPVPPPGPPPGWKEREVENYEAPVHAPYARWRVIASFDAREYGKECLSLRKGDIVSLASPQTDPTNGWSFGELEGDVNCSGWFPADHIARMDSISSLEVSADSLNGKVHQLDSDSDSDLSVSSAFTVSSKGMDPKCFLPGTFLIRADGSAAAVQDLRLGEKLKSISGSANEFAVVQKMELHDEAPVQVVQLTAGSTQEFVLCVTADHRLQLGCFNELPASHVKLGATIQSSAGPVQIIGKNETWQNTIRYELTFSTDVAVLAFTPQPFALGAFGAPQQSSVEFRFKAVGVSDFRASLWCADQVNLREFTLKFNEAHPFSVWLGMDSAKAFHNIAKECVKQIPGLRIRRQAPQLVLPNGEPCLSPGITP